MLLFDQAFRQLRTPLVLSAPKRPPLRELTGLKKELLEPNRWALCDARFRFFGRNFQRTLVLALRIGALRYRP